MRVCVINCVCFHSDAFLIKPTACPSEKNTQCLLVVHSNTYESVCQCVCLMVFLLVASLLPQEGLMDTESMKGPVCLHLCVCLPVSHSLDMTVQGSYILATPTPIFSRPSVVSVRLKRQLETLVISNTDLSL